MEQEDMDPTPTPTATPVPTSTPIPTPTLVATPTPTLIPSPTAIPTPTPTPLPTLVPLVLTLEATPEEGVVPLDVTFNATATGQIAEYRWDFDGDNTVDKTTKANTATHFYENTGTFHPKVTVLDGQAFTHTDTTTIIICSSKVIVSASVLPQVFIGTVLIDGQNAPDGTKVVARVGCETLGETTVSAGKYSITLSQPNIPSYVGRPMEFILGGLTAEQTATPVVGGLEVLDLTASTTK